MTPIIIVEKSKYVFYLPLYFKKIHLGFLNSDMKLGSLSSACSVLRNALKRPIIIKISPQKHQFALHNPTTKIRVGVVILTHVWEIHSVRLSSFWVKRCKDIEIGAFFTRNTSCSSHIDTVEERSLLVNGLNQVSTLVNSLAQN